MTAVAAVILFTLSFFWDRSDGITEAIARHAGQKTEKRIEILERYADRIISDSGHNSCLDDLPEDMVIYKYVNDSLVSWSNQFPLLNDDISNRLVFQRLTNLKSRITSPLTDVTDEYSYMNLGPKWYIVKEITGANNERIIAGVEIKNTLIDDTRRNENGVNPHLNIPGHYSVLPLNYSGGASVTVDDVAMFKILADSAIAASMNNTTLFKWLTALLLVISAMTFLAQRRTFKALLATTAVITGVFAALYAWGIRISDSFGLFSPNTYADGAVYYSLGALLLINTYIVLVSICIYMMRDKLVNILRKEKESRKRSLIAYCIVLAACISGTAFYIHDSLTSLMLNSNISLEFYRHNTNIPESITVYLSYISLIFCLLLFLQMLTLPLRELSRHRFNMLSKRSVIVFAVLAAGYLSAVVMTTSISREQDRVMMWANRLAVERDLGLEIRLKATESDIAADQIISSLCSLDGAESLILNRIAENYLSRIRQNYSLNLLLVGEKNNELAKGYSDLIGNGTQIYDGSRFFFISDGLGNSRYVGLFMYYSQTKGLIRMFLEIEPNSGIEDRGYDSIISLFSSPEGISIPQVYSFAKYADGSLTSYKGNYPYPTISEKFEKGDLQEAQIIRADGFTHFIHPVSGSEIIVISRPRTSVIVIFTSFSYTFLVITGLLMLFGRRRRRNTKQNFFRTRINIILFSSSAMILASMTVVSIFFVYRRNEENSRNMLSSRISTIQALIERHAKNAQSYADMTSPSFRATLEEISKTTKADISLYTPDGKVFYASRPEVFDKMILGNRIDREAYHNIRHLHQRFYINTEHIAGYDYQVLYAPIINSGGDIIAIVSIPYTGGDHDFRREAFMHAALLVNIFLLLLIIALLFSSREVNEMFAPLMEMGKKMSNSDLHNLQPINYKKEDEISSLVDAYNRMVKELADSTVRLAQAERDKAWSQMARQVAHEIKNPLTPIKLEIQRLIHLKGNGNPKWEERFDQVSAVILEHIDILTETANEFSTFAKLYSEDPVVMDLDKTIKEQILIFDNKHGIDIEYVGLENAIVSGPRPQLIRVFVNLITNAIQAVEIKQKEMQNIRKEYQGRIFIALRNGTTDGFYDIVVDDNGDGVKEENQSRLFTPNFTTKSGGTGLGLAICRNIIEKCDGTISYSRSFRLGGASFTVSLPKMKDTDQGL